MSGNRVAGWLLVVGGVVGFVAALVLTVERARVLGDPAYVPTCELSEVLSCGSVMRSPQASVFGFPNTYLGLAGFPLVMAGGVLALGGVAVPRLVRFGFLAGVLAAFGFVHWLVFISLYRVGALCPYCMVVWAALPVLVAASARWFGVGRTRLVVGAVAGWYGVVALLVALRFWT